MGKTQALRFALSTAAEALRETGTSGLDALVAATLAPECGSCHRSLESPLTGPICSWCWDEARAACGRYEGALRNIIHAFKYEGRRSLAKPLGVLLRENHEALLQDAACAVPVPLFIWRRLRRGFNQADELARHLDLPLVHALWRMRPTPAQAGLSAGERRRNVRGAFRLSPVLSERVRRERIDGQIVVLVDDVMTTGATARACSAVLMRAGAREVRVVTLARA